MKIDPRAGKPAIASDLVDVPKLIAAYYEDRPDAENPAQCVIFGTSGHRGSSFAKTFNEWHILAITQAICLYRKQHKIDGPLFLGIDTHALSRPAVDSALEVLAANGIDVMLAGREEYTPTPVISHTILTYNRGRSSGFADGIVITPSHNPPETGGFKYNPPHGGPAEERITTWIEKKANEFLAKQLKGVNRTSLEKALVASTTHRHDFLTPYVEDLHNVVDMDAIRASGISIGVDPLGGAGVHYWEPVAKRYGLNLQVVNETVDPTFRFMTLDWDGRIRMDPSSEYAMRPLIALKDKFDLTVACDTDHDRHGIVARSIGLLPPNHYLAVCVDYLFAHRPRWTKEMAVGKTVVSSSIIDRVAARQGRKVYEVPVGFKYFVEGLLHGRLGFAGEESAGSSFVRRDGSVWTTDKDGIIAALLAAEITAVSKRDPGELYAELARELGESLYRRSQANATDQQKIALERITASDIHTTDLAGEKPITIITKAPGDGITIGGIKVAAANGWFAARPSGTEAIYKIYAESFSGEERLALIEAEAQTVANQAFTAAMPALKTPQLQETK
ncbi:phosphoglucomutase (alpha-D-glucose-1,6-bisphosphate-dependent) [Granulicella aggregans]|uniref:phosphoglucomutase (alpha-D-glucose-1,6-bisphosphate-dependent) n=1 Tax=Granulicella aggregans TaxID=474949 RepID=UPI0021DFC1EF|nr:phosphoglucomutase (alpha-D-glucose-1,6-bisphosphate-dependent) [Granulicella aggregans]